MSITATDNRASGHVGCMLGRAHWSYSQLGQYLRCPLQYYFERVQRIPRPFVPASMVLGSAVHEALAAYHRSLQEAHPLLKEQVETVYLSAWAQNESKQPVQYKESEDRQAVLDQGSALLEAYLQEPPPENILAIEEPMIVPLYNSAGDFLERPLVAVVDLLSREGDGMIVSEFKTSGRRFSDSEAEVTLQASCYVHAIQERFGEPAGIRYVVLVKTKKPQVQYLNTLRTDSDLGRLGDVVQAVERAIEARAFYPNESPMNCSGCAYYRNCREWKGCNMDLQIEEVASC